MEIKQQISLEKIYKRLENLEDSMKRFEQFAEDVEFAKRTDEALKRIEAGEFISVDSENLSKEMNKW